MKHTTLLILRQVQKTNKYVQSTLYCS